MWSSTPSAVALAVLLGVAPAAAQPRSQHWRELAVTADLDADGSLHTRERHSMVFTGDWTLLGGGPGVLRQHRRAELLGRFGRGRRQQLGGRLLQLRRRGRRRLVRPYSCRSASIGSRCAARQAG